MQEIHTVLQSKKGIHILDIGCGKNLGLLKLLSNRYPDNFYVGCDVTSDVHTGKPDIEYYKSDFNCPTPFQDNQFDLIIAGEIIEHLYDTDNAFKELHRIGKNNCTIIITTPNLSSFIDRILLLLGFLPSSMEVSYCDRSFGRKALIKKNSPAVGHIRAFTWASLRDMALHYDFKIRKHIGCYHHTFLINKLIPYLIPRLSQQQLIVLNNNRKARNK